MFFYPFFASKNEAYQQTNGIFTHLQTHIIMRASLTIIFFIFLDFCTYAQDIKVIEGYAYEVENGQVVGDTVLSIRKYLNAENQLIQEEIFWFDEGENIKRTFFNAQEKKIKVELILKDSSFLQTTDFERDKKGSIIKHIITEDGYSTTIKNENKYQGDLLVETILAIVNIPPTLRERPHWPRSLTIPSSSIQFQYDKHNRMVFQQQLIDKKSVKEISFKYDKHNNIREEESIDLRRNTKEKYIYTYDKSNQLIQEEYFYNSKPFSITQYTWGKSDIILEETEYLIENYSEITYYQEVE